MNLSTSIIINKPPAKVFDAFADIAHRQDYIQEITRVDGASKLSAAGDSWEEFRSVGGTEASSVFTVTELIPNKLISVTNTASGLGSSTTYGFEPGLDANETKVTLSVGTKGSGLLGKLLNGLFSTKNAFFEQILQQELLSYKEMIERK